MRGKRFDTLEEAKQYSYDEARAQGCDPMTTPYWYSVIEANGSFYAVTENEADGIIPEIVESGVYD